MTTREQRLRELVERWRNDDTDLKSQSRFTYRKCADELAAILDEEVVVSEEMVERGARALQRRLDPMPTLDEQLVNTRWRRFIFEAEIAITAALKEPGQ